MAEIVYRKPPGFLGKKPYVLLSREEQQVARDLGYGGEIGWPIVSRQRAKEIVRKVEAAVRKRQLESV